MKIPYKTKLLSLFISSVVLVSGCVDVSNQLVPPSIDYSSQIKIVNLVIGSGTTSLSMNSQSLGSVDFGAEVPGPGSAFLTVPSGSKTLVATFSDNSTKSYQFSLSTDYKYRLFLVGDLTSSDASLIAQRMIFQTKDTQSGSSLFPDGKAQMMFFNGSPDASLNAVVFNSDTINFETPIGQGESTSYILVDGNADYNIQVIYNDSLVVAFSQNLVSRNRYTAVIFDQSSSLKNAVFLDD
ncbi:hypothetical protein [Ignavibacterium album]|uniref:hypothetical protein n=1 Tax=Ignavibacterium album TaxID=591197 RepID=UPI0035B784DC